MRISSAPLTPFRHPHSLRPGPPVIQAPLRALCSEIPKTHGRSSERQRCSLRSRADREFTRLPGPYSQAYIQTQNHLRTSRHLSRAISPSHLIENSIPFHIASHHINRSTHTQPFTADVLHIHKGSQQFPAVSFLMTAPLRSMPSASRHLHNIIRA